MSSIKYHADEKPKEINLKPLITGIVCVWLVVCVVGLAILIRRRAAHEMYMRRLRVDLGGQIEVTGDRYRYRNIFSEKKIHNRNASHIEVFFI